jgi:ABC-type sugar transport system ATPase subunit
MRSQIKAVLSNLSRATVIVTHDQLEALSMADRIAIMRDGRIEQVGSPHEVFARPANVFVASFIGTPQMNLIEAEFKGYGDGKATVTFDRQDVNLPAAPAVAALAPGRVTVGVRPRAFTVVAEDAADTIDAVTELIEPMGAETLIHARTRTGGDIRVVIPRDKKVKIGEPLHLIPDPMQTHIFAADGKAVRA